MGSNKWAALALATAVLSACASPVPGDEGGSGVEAPDPMAAGAFDIATEAYRADGSRGDAAVAGDLSVPVTLHPTHESAIGEGTLVAFGAPFARGALASVDELVVLDAEGNEIASHVEEIVPWRSLAATPPPPSVRSALVWVKVDFPSDEPVEIELRTGTRTLELGEQGDVTDTWVDVPAGQYDMALREPAVYAAFPVEWLTKTAMRTFTTPVATDEQWSWFDDFFVGAAHTMVNDVPDTVEADALVDFDAASPWQLDRAMTLFSTYTRTGDVKWLREAHLAVQYYVEHLDENGYVVWKDYDDLKYSYGQSPFVDMMLTGDRSMLDPIERVASAAAEWNPEYYIERKFWTERHQTYALLGALSAWEATGKPEHAERVRFVAETSFGLAKDPVNGWNADGCMLHSFRAHENFGELEPVCSPWMSAIFADAAWRYFLHSADEAALEFLATNAEYVRDYALYDGSDEKVNMMVPWYLASSETQLSDAGAWGDVDHACDVAGMVVRGAWARRELGGEVETLKETAQTLIDACQYDLDMWYRPTNESKPAYRLAPARKFNWWFGSTTDMPLLWSELQQ